MCCARILLASSMNGLLSVSESSFHSEPRRFDISELCILGLSWAICRRFIRDQTMKAFIGRLMCSPPCSTLLLLLLLYKLLLLLLLLLLLYMLLLRLLLPKTLLPKTLLVVLS